MASSRYGKGSILYKILIVILTAALVGSIWYPKKLWDEEARNLETCRQRMTNIYNAALMYQRFGPTGQFSDSLNLLIDFIKRDSTYHAYIDSSIGGRLNTFANRFDSLRTAHRAFADYFPGVNVQDSTQLDTLSRRIESITGQTRIYRDRLEVLREEMARQPYTPIQTFDRALEVVERRDYYLQYEIIRNMVAQARTQEAMNASNILMGNYDTVIENLRKARNDLNSIYSMIDSVRVCPTVRESYNVQVAFADTASTIREVRVACPIDSIHIARIESDFMLSTIGALKIENHGMIKGGEKSWEDNR